MHRPHSAILGNAEGTELFRNVKNFDNVSVHLVAGKWLCAIIEQTRLATSPCPIFILKLRERKFFNRVAF